MSKKSTGNLEFRSYTDRYIEHCNSPETRARKRRLSLFVNLLNATEVWDEECSRMLAEANLSSRDHVSAWSIAGVIYLLNEPYRVQCEPQSHDYHCITLPTNISPYCGSFSSDPAEMPSSRSFLITKSIHSEALGKIAGKLREAALTAPRWNI